MQARCSWLRPRQSTSADHGTRNACSSPRPTSAGRICSPARLILRRNADPPNQAPDETEHDPSASDGSAPRNHVHKQETRMSQNQRMLTPIELLCRGRERILRGWTQHVPARTASGTICGASDPAAVAWCALGAAWYGDDTVPDYVNDPGHRLYLEALAELRRSIAEVTPNEAYGGRVSRWNDVPRRTQADAVRLYDVTIARVAAAA